MINASILFDWVEKWIYLVQRISISECRVDMIWPGRIVCFQYYLEMLSHDSALPMRRFRMRQPGTVAYHPRIHGEICVDLYIVKQRATIKLVWKINKSMTNLDWHLSLLSCENTILSSNIASGSSRNICVKIETESGQYTFKK